MRVAVIGAGAVGGSIAAVLHRGGHDVEVTARGEQLDAIRSEGIRLTGEWGEHTARVDANPVLTRAPELTIIATKTLDAENALRDNAEWLVGIPVVVIQNGITALDTARAVLPTTDIVGGLALFAASFVKPGHVAITTSGTTYLGSTPYGRNSSTLAVEYAARTLGEVMPIEVTHNFSGAQWTKLIVNQINALPAITGTSAQATISNIGLRRVLTRSMQEAVLVAIHSGVRFEKMQGLSDKALRFFRRLPFVTAQLLPLFMKARMGSIPNPGSTLQSIRRGQKTEIDYLNGAIVKAAEASGTTAPTNSTIVELVHEVENTGVFLTAEQVVDRIRDARQHDGPGENR